MPMIRHSLAALSCTLLLLSCQGGATRALPSQLGFTSGRVVFSFREGGATNEKRLALDLATGEVAEVQSRPLSPQKLGSCETGELKSPDEEFKAICSSQSIILISQLQGHARGWACNLSDQKVDGFVWDQRSKYVIALAHSTRVSLNPIYLLQALTGHPKQFETYSIATCGLGEGQTRVYPSVAKGSSSFARMEGLYL